jgi:hypothetical protein
LGAGEPAPVVGQQSAQPTKTLTERFAEVLAEVNSLPHGGERDGIIAVLMSAMMSLSVTEKAALVRMLSPVAPAVAPSVAGGAVTENVVTSVPAGTERTVSLTFNGTEAEFKTNIKSGAIGSELMDYNTLFTAKLVGGGVSRLYRPGNK